MTYEIHEPDMPRQASLDIAEHEILLSFINDIDAEMFSDWWNTRGLDQFKKWAEKNGDKYK